jgi:hypothetical protein
MVETKEIVTDAQLGIGVVNSCLTRYAWGCGNTWFITKNKQQVMPKGSRLLMKLGCERTTLPLHTKDTYPTVGDVVSDTDGGKLLVVECDFF